MEMENKIKLNNLIQRFNIEKSIEGTVAYKIQEDIKNGLSLDDVLIKARAGIYEDNPVNRKLGRVGQKYGGVGKEDNEVKEKKESGRGAEIRALESSANVNKILSEISGRYYDKVEKVKASLELEKNHYIKLKEIMPSLEKTLREQHLEIKTFNANKTGLSASGDWKEGDKLRVSLKLEPISNKFKFVKDTGYNVGGNKRNQKSLNNRAKEIDAAINGIGEGISASTNQFSLEKRPTGIKNAVLVDVWIKA